MNVPLLMVIVFLLLTLVVAIYCRGKPISLRKYAIGNKDFPTATLVATTLAAVFGGAELIRNVEETYMQGLPWIIFGLSSPVGYLLLSPLMLRMGPFMHHLSLPESIGHSYGQMARVVVALVSIIHEVFGLACQIIALFTAASMCLEVRYPQLIAIAAAVVVIAYASFGGIRSVTFTDVLQLITFTFVIPMLAIWLLRITNKPIMPFDRTFPKFQLDTLYQSKSLLPVITLFLANLASFINPITVQRIYMAHSPIRARNFFIYSGIFSLPLQGCIALMALFIFMQSPTLAKEVIWDSIMHSIPIIGKGFIAISVFAMVMSTADSKLNACAVMVSHDLIEVAKNLSPFKKIIATIPPLRLARLTAIVMGSMAMLIAFKTKNLLALLMLMFNLAIPIITAPYLLALYGFRATSSTALIGMATGVAAILAWKQWVEPVTGIDGSCVCMVANGLAMLAAHYLLSQPVGKGWVTPDDIYQCVGQSKQQTARRGYNALKACITQPKVFLATLKPTTTALMGIGLYILVTNFICITTGYRAIKDSPKMVHILLLAHCPCLLIGMAFLTYAALLSKLSKRIQLSSWFLGTIWWVALVVILPLCSWYGSLHYPYPMLMLILLFVYNCLIIWVFPLHIALLSVLPLILLYPANQIVILWATNSKQLIPLLGLCAFFLPFLVYAKYRLNKQNDMKKETNADIRMVQIKMADRLHYLRTLHGCKPADQRRIAKETMAFFIPWGERHNVPEQWLTEMKRICSAILEQTRDT